MTWTPLNQRIAWTIRDHKLFNHGDTIIVALSGGADSCALLDILAGLEDPSPCLVVAHLNHCLRGAESDADEMFARELALGYGLPFESIRVDVKALSAEHGYNLEDAGRRARMAFLEDVARRHQARAIALAHHGDDQAETVLMRLLRGSGMTGLSAMSRRNANRIRPLLDVTRAEIEDYLKKKGLHYREDSSNRDTAFLRNRIRHQLLPLLEQYNPSIRRNLASTAELLADEDDLLAAVTDREFRQLARSTHNSVAFEVASLLQLHLALQRRVIRQALCGLTGDLLHISQVHIKNIISLLETGPPNRMIPLPCSLVARREYNRLVMERRTEDTKIPDELPIPAPGRYPLWDGLCLQVSMHERTGDRDRTKPDTAWFDLDKAPFPWRLRTLRPGDRITPLGMDGSKKVKDIFMDDKIPLPRRRRIPLVFSGETLIWITGVRMSAAAALDDSCRKIVRVDILRDESE